MTKGLLQFLTALYDLHESRHTGLLWHIAVCQTYVPGVTFSNTTETVL